VYWSRWLTVTKSTTRDSPVELEVNLGLGTIEEVKILFPPGCLGYVKCVLLIHEHQFLPEHPAGYISGDDYVFVFPMSKEITDKAQKVKVKAWNTAEVYDHAIMIGIFLRERPASLITRVAQTFSGLAGQTLEIE